MSTHLITPTALVRDGQLVQGESVLIEDGRIIGVGTDQRGDTQEQLEGVLLPGAIDLQVNGAGGRSAEEATAEALEEIAQTVRSGGATAFLPTLITAPFDVLLEQVKAVAAWCESYAGSGAQPLGLHVEGPFLEVAGAQLGLIEHARGQAVLSVVEAAHGVEEMRGHRRAGLDALGELSRVGRVSDGDADSSCS